uniref:RIKEN cDNA C130050O18 gene n=1 Tax=Mus musculus TaxID=10090 RepID=F7AVJ9_MOUSE
MNREHAPASRQPPSADRALCGFQAGTESFKQTWGRASSSQADPGLRSPWY